MRVLWKLVTSTVRMPAHLLDDERATAESTAQEEVQEQFQEQVQEHVQGHVQEHVQEQAGAAVARLAALSVAPGPADHAPGADDNRARVQAGATERPASSRTQQADVADP
jgi:hypothetical protein